MVHELTDEPPPRPRDSIGVNYFSLRIGADSSPQETNHPDEKHLGLYESVEVRVKLKVEARQVLNS